VLVLFEYYVSMKFFWVVSLVCSQAVQAAWLQALGQGSLRRANVRAAERGTEALQADTISERALFGAVSQAAVSRAAVSLQAKAQTLMMKILKDDDKDPGDMDVSKIAKQVHDQMDVEDAVKKLDGKLPKEVASLVSITSGKEEGSQQGQFDESSLQKARVILNDMIFTRGRSSTTSSSSARSSRSGTAAPISRWLGTSRALAPRSPR
jgi:hypothetical protein